MYTIACIYLFHLLKQLKLLHLEVIIISDSYFINIYFFYLICIFIFLRRFWMYYVHILYLINKWSDMLLICIILKVKITISNKKSYSKGIFQFVSLSNKLKGFHRLPNDAFILFLPAVEN